MTKSLYAILNVAPDADPAVIEAAYKALMKKYHPDVRTEEPESARRSAAEINEAFHVLKDPTKRAQYDTDERAKRDAMRRTAMAMAEPPRPYQPPPMPPRRRRSKWPALFMIAAAALAVFLIWRGSDAALGGPAGLPPIPFTQAGARTTELAPVKQEDVNRAVDEFRRIKERSGLLGLSAYSADCFAEQRTSAKPGDFDYCVAFDKAALTYGVDLPGADYLPQLPRFEAREIVRRHAAAGKLLSSDEDLVESRIAEVGILTSRRLRALTGTEEPAEAGAVAAGAATATAAAAAAAAAPAVKKRRSYRQQRSANYRRARPQRRPQQRSPQSNPDFLEREGYIY